MYVFFKNNKFVKFAIYEYKKKKLQKIDWFNLRCPTGDWLENSRRGKTIMEPYNDSILNCYFTSLFSIRYIHVCKGKTQKI